MLVFGLILKQVDQLSWHKLLYFYLLLFAPRYGIFKLKKLFAGINDSGGRNFKIKMELVAIIPLYPYGKRKQSKRINS